MATIERAIPVGGASLNFKVVGGTTEPANPKENTIWVNTDVEITGYTFSALEPDDLAEGAVWISTGASSNVAFSATKKNAIMICPIYARQFVGGALVDRVAKSYQGGEWRAWWRGELYTPGNEWERETGGWVLSGDGTLYRSDECLTLTPTAKGAYSAWAKTANAVDLRGYYTLDFDVYGTGSYTDIYLGVLSTDDTFVAVKQLGGMNGVVTVPRGIYTVDVSALNGKYTPAIKMYNGASHEPVSLQIYNIVMN